MLLEPITCWETVITIKMRFKTRNNGIKNVSRSSLTFKHHTKI